jgi:hypothetical protein
MTAWIILILFGVIAPVTGIFVLLPRALGALRSSGFESYGFRVTRAQNPFRFWLAVVTWLFLAGFSLFIGVFAFADFIKG